MNNHRIVTTVQSSPPDLDSHEDFDRVYRVIDGLTRAVRYQVGVVAAMMMPEPSHASTLKQFRQMKPPAFQGTLDPKIAKSRIKELEKLFKVLKCTNDQRVAFVVYMLQGEAHLWWNLTRRTIEDYGDVWTLNAFLKVFHENYFVQSV